MEKGWKSLTVPCVSQGDANRSESDDEKKSDNFEEDEKVEQLRDTGRLTQKRFWSISVIFWLRPGELILN